MIESSDFREAVCAPIYPVNQKIAFLDSVCSKVKLQDLTRKVLGLMVRHHTIDSVSDLIKSLHKKVSQARGIFDVEIYTSAPLGSQNKKQISDILTTQLGKKKVIISEIVDRSLCQGLIIKFDTYILDCSLKGQLLRLKNHLESHHYQLSK